MLCLPSPPHWQALVCVVPLPMSMCSHCSTPTYEWVRTCGVWFSVLENDGFQIHPYPYEGNELILFNGCLVFHGTDVPHFLYPVYHWWAFGLVPGLCYCKPCHNEHIYMCMCLYNRMIYNPLGIYPVMGLLGQMEFLFLGPWGIATLSSTWLN